MMVRQIMESVWLVGGVDRDVRTDERDCHMYLIHDGAGGLLVDSGTGLGSSAWLEHVASVCDPTSLAGVLLTHYHADHAGGASAANCALIPVLASGTTAAALATADEERTSLARARAAGFYATDYALPRAAVDTEIAGGTVVRFGRSEVLVLDAPGHCDGHLAFLSTTSGKTVLFSGDCVFAGGRVSIQALHDCRLDQYADTLIRLAELDVDTLLPGHGELVLDGAGADVRRAADSFRRLVPPPNILS